jgi:flagellar hook-length control protein FliK
VARGLVAPVQSAPAPITPPVTPVPQDAATPVEIIVPRDLATRATTDRSVAHPRDAAPMPSPTHGFDLRGAAVTPLAPAATAPATTVASAAQLFASAITGWTGPGTRGEPAPAADPGQLAQAAQATRMPVTAMSATDQAPLDLTREDWTGQMIERIATLRDSAEAADTRIKLAPENLGALDISIRRDGDRIHVHFNAENPAARQLLSEAAPRLAELADARGVKLGQTSVDSGTGGQQGQPRQQAQTAPARPVAVGAQAAAEHTDNQRIA